MTKFFNLSNAYTPNYRQLRRIIQHCNNYPGSCNNPNSNINANNTQILPTNSQSTNKIINVNNHRIIFTS
jgi:hypothetical protein